MKILYLYPNKIAKRNWGYQLFRNEIASQHDVTFYGKHYKFYDPHLKYIPDIIDKLYRQPPDIIMTFGGDSQALFNGFEYITDILKVHFLGDYNDSINSHLSVYKNNISRQNNFLMKAKFDIIFTLSYRALELLRKNKICDITKCIPFSIDTNIYKDLGLKKINDVMAVWG